MADPATSCGCSNRPTWSRVDDDSVMQWPVVELAEWEELRQCPDCGRHWLAAWPDELGGRDDPLQSAAPIRPPAT